MNHPTDGHVRGLAPSREVQISKQDLRIAKLVGVERAPLATGEARLRVDLFAMTSNNITYAAMGEGMAGYWDFFPGNEAWGRLPVWGFATVIASTVPELEEGTRHYGFFPMAETVDMSPVKVTPHGVALTSARQADYVRATGLYARTLTYNEASSLSGQAPVTYVDFLGDETLNAAVHRVLGANLTDSILVGATDWATKPGGVRETAVDIGPTPEVFFVPSYAPERMKADHDLGAGMLRDIRAFYDASSTFFTPQRLTGAPAILDCWTRLAAGEAHPQEGYVLSF